MQIIEFQDGTQLTYLSVEPDPDTRVDDYSGLPMRKVWLRGAKQARVAAWVVSSRSERYDDAVAGRLGFVGIGSREGLGLLLQVNEPGGAN